MHGLRFSHRFFLDVGTPGASIFVAFGSWDYHFRALGPSWLQGWPPFSVLGAVLGTRLRFRTRFGGPGYQNGPEKEHKITTSWSKTFYFCSRLSIDFRRHLLSNFITLRGAPNFENVAKTQYCRPKTKVPPSAKKIDFLGKWKLKWSPERRPKPSQNAKSTLQNTSGNRCESKEDFLVPRAADSHVNRRTLPKEPRTPPPPFLPRYHPAHPRPPPPPTPAEPPRRTPRAELLPNQSFESLCHVCQSSVLSLCAKSV